MKFKAVLFDLDGTLIDTVDDIGDAVNRVLLNKGFTEHTISTYRQFVGDGSKNLITRAKNSSKITAVILLLRRGLMMAYRKCWMC